VQKPHYNPVGNHIRRSPPVSFLRPSRVDIPAQVYARESSGWRAESCLRNVVHSLLNPHTGPPNRHLSDINAHTFMMLEDRTRLMVNNNHQRSDGRRMDHYAQQVSLIGNTWEETLDLSNLSSVLCGREESTLRRVVLLLSQEGRP